MVHFTRRDHPTLGPRLFIYQPTRVTEQLHVLHDFDILEGSEPDLVFSPKGRSYKAVSPGVSCDLFLTSLCIFERGPGMMASFKTAILQKWQLLSRADEMESVVPLFYRGMTFGRSYSQMLREEIREIESNRRNRTSVHGTLERSSITPSNIQKSSSFPAKSGSGYSAGYRELYLTPLQQQASEIYPEIDISQQVEQLYPIVCEIRDEDTAFTLTRFSSNSSGLYAEILTSASPGWQRVYIKNAASVPDELEALPSVQHYFPKERVQVLAAAQPALQRIFFQRFLGETLNDIRLRYHHDEGPVNGDTRGRSCFSDEWFVNLDLQRARDNLAVYSRTFRREDSSIPCAQQRIHKFFHLRLVGNRRLQRFYGEEHSDFFPQKAHGTMSLEAFSDLPMVINGRKYQNLQHHLDRALLVLDPNRIGGLNSLPTAFGMGDGHGGNVMISNKSTAPSILYVDYEVAGTHTPFLDLAKPIYQDGFFKVAYADFLHDDLTQTSERDGISVNWRLEEETIYVDYDLTFQTLSKGLAIIKLEYLLRPILEALDQSASSLRELAEETLAYALFACALLTRNYSLRPDVFFLNLAVGVRLATEMRTVFSECFDWCNWTPRVPHTQEPLQPAIGEVVAEPRRCESQHRSTSQDSSYLPYSYTRPQGAPTCVDLTECPGGQSMVDGLPKRMSDLMFNIQYGISTTLEPEYVYLKREADTLTLHRKFSDTRGESVSMVTQRISDTRKKAMKVSNTTCY